ncbi:MAG: tRNA (adenosine(37)-N6)-threonylcarbamoyltransferase complex ATPase subunit type 1 TsaE [Pyrinomonadaceae bacterium]
MNREITANTPDEMFSIGESLAENLNGGEVILLYGGLGAGKTLLTKGIMSGLDYDVDEVTSPSFTLVNLYETERFDVYHIDLWRLDPVMDTAEAVGLGEILENERAVAIIEWADRLGDKVLPNVTTIRIEGDGDEPRQIFFSRDVGSDRKI